MLDFTSTSVMSVQSLLETWSELRLGYVFLKWFNQSSVPIQKSLLLFLTNTVLDVFSFSLCILKGSMWSFYSLGPLIFPNNVSIFTNAELYLRSLKSHGCDCGHYSPVMMMMMMIHNWTRQPNSLNKVACAVLASAQTLCRSSAADSSYSWRCFFQGDNFVRQHFCQWSVKWREFMKRCTDLRRGKPFPVFIQQTGRTKVAVIMSWFWVSWVSCFSFYLT